MQKYLSWLMNLVLLCCFTTGTYAQSSNLNQSVPAVYTGIMPNENGKLYFLSVASGDTCWAKTDTSFYVPNHLMVDPQGTQNGLFFDFKDKNLYGKLYFGLYSEDLVRFNMPTYTKSTRIIAGTANLDLRSLFDKKNSSETPELAYRIVDQYGQILYDGSIRVRIHGSIEPALTIVEGPFVNLVDDRSAVISFITNQRCNSMVLADDREFRMVSKSANMTGEKNHEIRVDHLSPATEYSYDVHFGEFVESYSFTTAPVPGTANPFTFAFTSTSRAGLGGGENDILGVNATILQKAATLAAHENAVFFQFTGNLISGYTNEAAVADQQYHNWKKAVEPFRHYIPYYIGMGDHESVETVFDDGSKFGLGVDRFPFLTASSETIFSSHFVHPLNGPENEDGADYDPHPDIIDFPSYHENAYSYTYDNLAVIVLNSSYWLTPSAKDIPMIGGNPSGYIMDNQLKWLAQTLLDMEKDNNIDHIIITLNSPVFPTENESTGMWYYGKNTVRPYVASIPVKNGIVERRDELLKLLGDKSTKTGIILCAQDQGYSRMKFDSKSTIYPVNYRGKKIGLNMEIHQISCGLSGTNSKKSLEIPWSGSVEKSVGGPAVVFVRIDGNQISLRVINPQTLEIIEEVKIQ
ncbi:MAG: hypothetical protein WC341_09460 [Bacteroidales bacterium]|jgi:hypothetical protein